MAQLAIASDLIDQGFVVALPYGDTAAYDLVAERDSRFWRVQVKYVISDGLSIEIPCRSVSVTNGRATNIKKYTSHDIDVIAAYEPNLQQCVYLPASMLGDGRRSITLRFVAPLRSSDDTRWARDFRKVG